MHLPEEQKTKISVHAETYCYRIVSAYVYTPASTYINLYLPEKRVLQLAAL